MPSRCLFIRLSSIACIWEMNMHESCIYTFMSSSLVTSQNMKKASPGPFWFNSFSKALPSSSVERQRLIYNTASTWPAQAQYKLLQIRSHLLFVIMIIPRGTSYRSMMLHIAFCVHKYKRSSYYLIFKIRTWPKGERNRHLETKRLKKTLTLKYLHPSIFWSKHYPISVAEILHGSDTKRTNLGRI